MGDIQATTRAVLKRGLFGWRRLNPKRYVVLEPVYSQEALKAAEREGLALALTPPPDAGASSPPKTEAR